MSSADLPATPDPVVNTTESAQPGVPSELAALGRYLYNHNPFYPLSAVLLLLGLHSLFHDEHAATHLTDIGFNNAILWLVLASFATVLSGTAVWLIRWGQVWDDARTILLTLVLLLVALSVNCDKPISLHVPSAPWLLLGGLAFAIGLAELTLRWTGIRLPIAFRLPMHLFFALFFLYPIGLDYCLNTIGDQHNALGWQYTLIGVLLFPSIAGLIALTLLPAAMRGPQWIEQPTAAWKWPVYPWSLYIGFAIAVVFRAFYLTISFHPRAGTDSAFAPYFLTPFALATASVVFELGRSVQHRLTQNVAMAAPLLCLPASLTGQPPCDPAGDFLCIHRELIGSPLQVSVAGLLVLYGYIWLRRGPAWTAPGIVGLTCLAAAVGPHTLDIHTFGPATPYPLFVAAAICLYGALRVPRSSLRWFGAATLAIGGFAAAVDGTVWVQYHGALAWHAWLVAAVVIGAIGTDRWAEVLRSITAAVLVALAYGLLVYTARGWPALAPWITWVYLLALTGVAWITWGLRRSNNQLATASLVSLAAGIQSALTTSAIIRESHNPRGWVLVLAGLICFVAALLVSGSKMRSAKIPLS